ncbi:hypothetical protein C804_01084 [Lachnospiraceae bacterium A4]|nr:hypothetical protein C804_01084 [Lachnospiraceae bacterium A4]
MDTVKYNMVSCTLFYCSFNIFKYKYCYICKYDR